MQSMLNSARTSLPGWILVWFIFTAILCTWDAFFILLRPHTFPEGKYNAVWYPYRLYINVDQRYRDISDGFVFAVSLMNCAEVVFNLATLLLYKQKSQHTVPLGFTVSVMTFWKTIMYFLMLAEICGGHNFRKGNGVWQEIFILAIPNGIWIVFPFFVMAALWRQMMARVDREESWDKDNDGLNAAWYGHLLANSPGVPLMSNGSHFPLSNGKITKIQ